MYMHTVATVCIQKISTFFFFYMYMYVCIEQNIFLSTRVIGKSEDKEMGENGVIACDRTLVFLHECVHTFTVRDKNNTDTRLQ